MSCHKVGPMRIQIIIGSVRQGRNSKPVCDWIEQQLRGRTDFQLEVVDLKDWNLPMFDLPGSPAAGKYQDETQIKWAECIARGDGYIFITPEYNHAYSAVLKNALDYLFAEWNRKPATFVSFGGVGGARAVEQLRQVLVELRMAPLGDAVHIQNLWGKVKEGSFHGDESDLKQLNRAVDQLVWWTDALKTAREK